jgi:beta-lactamase class A
MNKRLWHALLGATIAGLSSMPAYGIPTNPSDIPPIRSQNGVGDRTAYFAGGIPIGNELTDLKASVRQLMANYSFLSPTVFVVDVETGNYLDIQGEKAVPAASTIKLPILIALFEAVDAGKVDLNEILTVSNRHITRGSGNLQYQRGKQLTLLETATQMIVISDNTATNMVIDRLGGMSHLNSRFRSWGLKHTRLHSWLGDFRGTNKTSAADLVRLSARIAKRELISPDSRAKALDILNATENRKLLAAGLGEGAHIAHKTGDIGFIIGDAGIVEKPDGKLYLIGVFVRRPYNDIRARYFVQQLSRLTYNHLNNPAMNTFGGY